MTGATWLFATPRLKVENLEFLEKNVTSDAVHYSKVFFVTKMIISWKHLPTWYNIRISHNLIFCIYVEKLYYLNNSKILWMKPNRSFICMTRIGKISEKLISLIVFPMTIGFMCDKLRCKHFEMFSI